MKFRTTYILFGCLAAMLILLAVAMYFAGRPSADAGKFVFPSAQAEGTKLKPEDVDRVEVEWNRPQSQKFVLARNGDTGRWEIVEPRALRANDFAVGELVQDMLTAKRAADYTEDPPPPNAAGLEPPAGVITLKKGDRALQLQVGDTSLGKEKAVVYVASSDRPKEVIPVPQRDLTNALKGLNALREHTLLAANATDYQLVHLEEREDKAVKGPLVLKEEDGRWRYRDPAGYEGPAEEGDAGAVPPPDKPAAGVKGLLGGLSKLSVAYKDEKDNDFVADGVPEKELDKYNLDAAKSAVLTIDVNRIDHIKGEGDKKKNVTTPVLLLVGVGKKLGEKADEKKADDKAKPDDKPNPDARYYAALRTDEKKDGQPLYNVVKVPAQAVEPVRLLFKDPTALRSHTLAPLASTAGPDAVRVKLGASDVLEFFSEEGPVGQFGQPGKGWKLYRGDSAQPTDNEAVQRLVNQLVQKVPDLTFIEKAEPDKLGLKEPKAVVSIWTDALASPGKDDKKDEKKDADKKDEKKDEKKKPEFKKGQEANPAVRLSFGDADDKTVVVKRETRTPGAEDKYDVAYVKAPVALFKDFVNQAPLAYYNKKLPQFNEGALAAEDEGVTKLELTRGGTTYVMTRKEAKPDAEWSFDAPDGLKGRKADPAALRFILGRLNRLRATTLVTEKSADDALYGLNAPSLKAVVTKEEKKGDKTETASFTFEFGNDVPPVVMGAPPSEQYARQSQRPMVFTVPKTAVGDLKDRELLDPTIFDYDPSKVKALKLVGWRSTNPVPLTLEFEKKDGKWEAKPPDAFKADSERVRTLVERVAKLKAERILTDDLKKKVKEVFDKDEDKTALTVEFALEGMDGPVQLKIVDLTAAKAAATLGADAGYYATTPKWQNELFKVPADVFKEPMSKAAYFSP
jgi:hypothetical protein